ncbi:uncharacterized protein LOC133521274 [Cydia pomonella]|uniref:uncharacterized protein LOC133521274 n=1 Tax=Cydia pomonella TaxID=82600 RepID=UPI002ADDA70F|nr:uncharacterized protein LOC133521274 [Cydia pomonella]
MALNGASKITIHTVDSDVVVIAISFYFTLHDLKELWISFGTGKHHNYIPVHEVANHLGADKAEALRGYHVFTGCDTVSAFYSKSKTLTWNTWQRYPEVTAAFKGLSNPLEEMPENVFNTLEKYVVRLYCGHVDIISVNDARKFLFTTKNRSLQNIPPTKDALKMHIMRAAYQAGQVWGQALKSLPEIVSPMNWGWTDTGDVWKPTWITQAYIWESVSQLTKCSCKKGCRGRCSCSQKGLQCTQLCNCRGNCDNSSIIDSEALLDEMEDGTEDDIP